MTPTDLVLSSGFLAFARHIGVLRALEEQRIPLSGICGTSSGALVGALAAAGLSSDAIAAELSRQRPVALLRLHGRLWRGAMSLTGLVERLSELLPPTFEELPTPLAVGVARGGRHQLLSSGPLPEAVAASCAIPGVFVPVTVEGVDWADGAAVDRLGLDAWRALRGPRQTLVHVVQRSHGPASAADLSGCTVVHSDRSRASFLSLRDFDTQVDESYDAALQALRVAA
jgi:predicted acylesterase/phospholipase RssA